MHGRENRIHVAAHVALDVGPIFGSKGHQVFTEEPRKRHGSVHGRANIIHVAAHVAFDVGPVFGPVGAAFGWPWAMASLWPAVA